MVSPPLPEMSIFQSTLSVRRATVAGAQAVQQSVISIHALREESDTGQRSQTTTTNNISIHALREESDTAEGAALTFGKVFQSTLSVRRATQGPLDERGGVWHFNPRSP